jgi:conjugative relaxase-like TrwC/TraI family protein
MLTIGKLGTTRGRLEYYDAKVAAGAEDYYAGRGESPGRWRGAGLRALSLAAGGRVERSAFMALMRGRDPVDGTVLRPMGARSTVAGFDLTFSAPKSVSVLFAIEDETVSAELLAAHERAVDAALAYLEHEACWTRRGRDGVDRIRGEGFIAASYRHRMSRAGDPQLHTHVVVGNLTRAKGRYTALDARSIYEHKSAGGAVYRAVLRAEVRERLPWLSWREVGRGLFELEEVSEPVLRHFSRRRMEIEERAEELVGVAAAGEISRQRMQGIALATRKAKSYGVDGGSWRDEARARAAEHGLGERELASLRTRRARDDDDPDLVALFARLSGPNGLTEQHNAFARRHALAEIAGASQQGATIGELEATTSAYLEDPTVKPLNDSVGERVYTTLDLLACEREIIDGARRRVGENAGVLAPPLVEGVLASFKPALNADQTAAVKAITSSGRGVDAVSALAGTGKTTMIGAFAAAYREAGWQVTGAAPTARAARQLRELAGVEADTMHALLGKLERTQVLTERTVLVLDEAGMAPTRHSAQLFVRAELAGAKVVAIGDPGQLGAVEAGGWLATLGRLQPGPTLREILRQTDPGDQRALQALRDGNPEAYLAHNSDLVHVHEKESEAIRELIDAWSTARAEHGERATVMIARDNLTREQLNRAARTMLKRELIIDPDPVLIGGREYAVGDRVIARRNDRSNDIDNGSIGTIVAIDHHRGSIIIETDSGDPRALEPDYITEHIEHAYALTAHGAQGATVSWAGVIGRAGDFTREWAYTALSRARTQTTLYVIGERSEMERERDEYAPPGPDLEPEQTLQALHRSMKRSELEPLAAERAPAQPPEVPSRSSPDLMGLEMLRKNQRQPGRRIRL